MKFVSGRIVLDKAVSLVSNALPSKDYGDATSGILMEVDKNSLDTLTLAVNSVEVFIKTKIKLQENGEAGVVVPNGNILCKVVDNLKNLKNPVVMEYDDKDDILNLSCGKDYSGSLAHYDSMGFIMPKSIDEISKLPTISVPVRLIKSALDEVAFSCSKDKTHIQLTGIYFDQNDNGMNVVGSDSLRLSAILFRSKINTPKSVILAVSHLNLLKKLFSLLEIDDGETIKLYLSDDMAYFIHGDTVIGFQTYGDKYYDEYKKLIFKPEQCQVLLKLNKEMFLEKLNLAVSHNSSAQDAIMLGLKSKNTGLLESKISSTVSNVNTFSIPFSIMKFVYNGKGSPKKFSVSISPQFLYDVLNSLKEKEFMLGLVDVKSGPAVVYPIDSDKTHNISGDYMHVFSLVE
jgi:DNA polymerase III sliding clamp (beta) subunit (PCNA family)